MRFFCLGCGILMRTPNPDIRKHSVSYMGFERITTANISGNVVFEFIR